ncbi:MAG: ABC transporter permease [Lachnospiraceae bacterium]|nr:ABC transporter permease [Lachnospiraceae bacterium]
MMKRLIRAELKKLKRQKMVFVGYLSILFSFILTFAQQMRIKVGAPEWEGFAEMFFYNNAMLFLPFTVSLIGGYMIDQEYAGDTLKNLLVIPVRWQDAVKAKVAVLFLLMVRIALFEMALLLAVGILFSNCPAVFIIANVCMKAIAYNICITLGILPVILWFGQNGGKYIWGSILSMLVGVSGVFVVNGRAAYWHPVTSCFSFLSDIYGRKSAMGYLQSGAAILLYGVLGVLVYWIRYCRETNLQGEYNSF